MVESDTDVRLAEELDRRVDLSIVARSTGGSEVSQPARNEIAIAVGPQSRLRFAAYAARELWRRRRLIDAAIVQGYGPAALVANVVGRIGRVPVIMLICSPSEAYYRCRQGALRGDRPYRAREYAFLRWMAWLNARVGGRYIALSRHLEQVVAAHRPGHGRVRVVPVYGVDTSAFVPPTASKARLRARLDLPVEGKILFFSSRIAPEKDTETLLEAFQLLLAEGRDLWLVNRSGGYEQLEQEAERHGLRGRMLAGPAVHPRLELPSYYQASDLCVQASRAEGLGFSPLEALACGIPVVAADVGGLRETIRDGQTGWTYPPGDAVALARAVRAALDDSREAARRTANGRELVLRRFDQELVFEHLLEALQTLARD